MKKNIYRILLLLFGSVILVSCDSFLNKEPLEDLSKDKFWNTAKDAELWMVGMYDAMQSALGHNYFMWGDLRSDNIRTSRDITNYVTNNLTSSMGESNWSSIYRTISAANFAIKYFPQITEITEAQLKDYLGQAYTTRALMYFYAIRVWGGVPIITEPYEGLEGQIYYNTRSEVSAVKALILSDIDAALFNFTLNAPSITNFNRGSALAIKMDLHMWFKEYDLAIKASDDLIAMNKYAMATNEKEWKNIFDSPTTSKEPIFFLDWDALTDGKNGIQTNISSDSPNPQYKLTKELWDSMVVRKYDFRWWYCTDTVKMWNGNNKQPITEETYNIYVLNFYECKFARYDSAKDNGSTTPPGGYVPPTPQTYMPMIPLYRFTDIMLLRAEAFNKVGRGEEARDIVNTLRTRTGYLHTETIVNPSYVPNPANPTEIPPTIDIEKNRITALSTPDGRPLEDVILNERRFEFFGEGKRWFDIVRTDRVLEIMNPVLIERGVPEGFGDIRRILWPLHSSVFERNPLLKQNEPYTQN